MKVTQSNKNQFPAIVEFLHSVVGDFYLEKNVFNTFVSLDDLMSATEKENITSIEKLKNIIKDLKEGKLTKENIDNHFMFNEAPSVTVSSISKQKEKIYFKDFMEAVTAAAKVVRFKDPKDVFVVESEQHARYHSSGTNSQRVQIPSKEVNFLAPVKRSFMSGVSLALQDYVEVLEGRLKQKLELEEPAFKNLNFGPELAKGVITIAPQKLYSLYNKELFRFIVTIEAEDEARAGFVFYGLQEAPTDWVNT